MPSTWLSRASRRSFSSAPRRLAVAARLDRLAQPDALLVVGDVLDLVGDRAAVDLAQPRVRVGERLRRRRRAAEAVPGCAPSARASASGSAARARVPGRPAARSRAGRVRAARWPCVRYALTSDIAAATPPSSSLVRRRRLAARERGRSRQPAREPPPADARSWPSPWKQLEQPRQAGLQREQRFGLALEERPPLGRHRARIVEVLLEEQRRVARVQSVDLRPGHPTPCCSRASGLPERTRGDDRDHHAEEEAGGDRHHGREREPLVPSAHRGGDERDDDRGQDQAQRMPGDADQATKIASAARKPATVSEARPRPLDRAHRRSPAPWRRPCEADADTSGWGRRAGAGRSAAGAEGAGPESEPVIRAEARGDAGAFAAASAPP